MTVPLVTVSDPDPNLNTDPDPRKPKRLLILKDRHGKKCKEFLLPFLNDMKTKQVLSSGQNFSPGSGSGIRIRIRIHFKMLDPDPLKANTDPKPCL